MKKGSVWLIIIVVVLVGGLIYFMPSIYKWNTSLFKRKVKDTSVKKEETGKLEKITLESDVIKDLVFPNMNNNVYSNDNHFQKNTFAVSDMSNQEILSFAFKEIYSGYLVSHDKAGCATDGKAFESKYIDFRIKNMISNTVQYKHEDFTSYDGDYQGLWKYDGSNYVYNGNCTNNGNTLYYDLQKIVDVSAKDDNKTLELTAKVGFAKVEGNNYIIYSDANRTAEIDKGVYTSVDDLNNKLANLNVKKYKYTFKQGLCSYEAYCILKGEWINE